MQNFRVLSCAAIMAMVLAACSGGGDNGTGNPAGSATAAPVPAQGIAPPASAAAGLHWDDLDGAVGKYARDIDLFDQGQIAEALQDLVGDDYDVLQTNLSVAGPLRKSGGVYYLTGNAPHEGGSDQAYVLIEPVQQAIEVGLWQKGKFTLYASPGATVTKPTDVQTMIDNTAVMAPAVAPARN